jgi:serine/threonine protein kinase
VIGTTVGHYRIVDLLGRGGSGTVYKGVDETLQREVAIKVLNPDLGDRDAMRRFLGEATILAKLNHPSIATIYEMFQSDTDLFMVMEFVRGKTLDTMSNELGAMPPDRAAWLIDQILSALAYAHRAGVVHRDMKPANVMVTDTGAVKLMDFGIARVRGADRLTIDGAMLGTPAYMAPEQVLSQDVDGRTDLYAVGVIFYRLLTAALPFDADTPIAMLQRQLSEAPSPLGCQRQGLPDWCDTIVQRALAKTPADRFQTAEAFREALAHGAGLAASPDPAQTFAGTATGDGRIPVQSTPPRTLVLSSAPVGVMVAASSSTDNVPAKWPAKSALLATAKSAWSSLQRSAVFSLAESAWSSLQRSAAFSLAESAWSSLQGSTLFSAAESVWSSWTEKAEPILTLPQHVARIALGMLGTALVLFALVAPRLAPTTAASWSRDWVLGRAGRTSERLVFRIETLVGTGRWQRERNARLALEGGAATVMTDSDGSPVYSVAYGKVTSINYSIGRDPMWRSPTGPARVAHAVNGGVLDSLGIVVDRHWISLGTTTTDRFIVFRVSYGQVSQVLSALEERTGLTTQRIIER